MQVTYQNQPEDFFAILRALSWRERIFGYLQVAGLGHCVWPLLLILVILQEWEFLGWIGLLLGVFLLYYTYTYARNWWQLPKHVFIVPGEQQVRLTDDFLEATSQRGSSRRRWKYVSRIIDQPEHLMIYVHSQRYMAIPKKYFASPEEAQAFFARANQLRADAQDKPLPPLDWETFRRDFDLDELPLIKYLKWTLDPKLSARIDTLGADQDGTKTIPTLLGLIGQTIFPSVVVLFLFSLKLTSENDNPLLLNVVYFTLLLLAILFAFIFGMQLHTYRQYSKSLARQAKLLRPEQIWFYAEGIGSITEEGHSFHRWNLIGPVENDREAIVILDIPPFIYGIIPKASFESPEEEEVLRERMQECYERVHETALDATLVDGEDEAIVADLADNPFRSPPTKRT
ncbi:YcxB family protein [Blastopirellula marina]|uniref:YcxB-like C-terminal domain-containing protein n=1 Tax=Blastopirellula marina TaxID=124 RepID=A0A2S8FHB5_9BACT|nr:YcxB family protein [Blastopirellula marina]PQO31536.1 hypothetical protein C5Y98_19120 [Blastopirellula marina]PTL42842.1 hypothetical protein C5Y97_19130 [Blastopirellula marina]